MSNLISRKSGEGNVSRYIQQNVPASSGDESRATGPSSGAELGDGLVKLNSSLGGKEDESRQGEKELTSNKGQYGKVRVLAETKKGHVILVDETDGNERLFLLHPKGTYINIDETGDKTEKTEGNTYSFVSKNWQIEIAGNNIEFIYGNQKIVISGNKDIKVDGNQTEEIQGNLKISVSGNVDIKADGKISLEAPNISLN